MRHLVMLAVTGAFLVSASTAFSATAVGVVKSVDTKGDAITLSDGKVFILAEGTEAESFKVGEKVKVTFQLKAGRMVATKVQIAK